MSKLKEFVQKQSPEDQETLMEFVRSYTSALHEVKEQNQKIDFLKHEIHLLKKKLFGRSSEKQKDTDILTQKHFPLFDEFEYVSAEETDEAEALPGITVEENIPAIKKKPGRKKLPKNLPRTIVEHDLSTDEKDCACGATMECIGSQVSEELEYVPASLKIIEHHCKKYVCACCAKLKEADPSINVTIKTAKKPAQLIEKGFASPGLLAQIAAAKFCDHLPLYRQSQIFSRLSVDLSRQTMSNWMVEVGKAVTPLINLLQDHILNYDIAYADETVVQVLNEPGRRAQNKSYMWCFLGGPSDQRSIIYQYHPSRSGKIPMSFFMGYQGALHCDGYAGYDALISTKGITGINCMAHVRRKFVEALPNGKEKGVSGTVVKTLRQLYKIEENLSNQQADADTIKTTRQEKAKPILEKLKTYLDEKSKTALPQSPIAKAIFYALKRWDYLTTYLEDGRYEIDNNRTERAIKPFVCGRKNWLFSNSQQGATSSANLFSLIETAKASSLNPMLYLSHIFKELPKCAALEDYEALLPFNLNPDDKAFFQNSI